MRDSLWLRAAPLLTCLLFPGCAARVPFAAAMRSEARWIGAAWPHGPPRPCPPVPLYWYAEQRCPLLYASEIEVPEGALSGSALLRSAAHVYVYVDGRQVYAWPPPGPPQVAPAQSDPTRTHAVDIGRELSPGRHVLTVSASADGFVLAGHLYDRNGRRRGAFASNDRWRAARYAATTVMEPDGLREPPLEKVAVAVGEVWSGGAPTVDDVEYEFGIERLHAAAAESEWRIALFRERGIYEVDGSAYGGLGFRRDAGELAAVAVQEARLREGGDPVEVLAVLRRTASRARLRDERKALRLIASEVGAADAGVPPVDALALRAERRRLESRLDHPTNVLNRSRYDRLGWVPLPGLLDNDPAAWGLTLAGDTVPPVLGGAETSPRVAPARDGAPAGHRTPARVDESAPASSPALEVMPLSPAVRFAPRGSVLRFAHAGRLRVGVWNGRSVVWRDEYRRRRDGRLLNNWVLVHGAAVAPVLLVFERNPEAVRSAAGATRIDLAGAGEHVFAVRPFGQRTPRAWDGAGVADALTLWSRAARARPTDYVSVTRVLEPGDAWRELTLDRLPRGPLLGQSVVYEFAVDSDEWSTEALRLAPLPPFASYALERGGFGFAVDEATAVVQPAGALSPYRAVVGADRVHYRYRVEPYPRFAGFTSWMFTRGDVGVPGNAREMRLLAATGANSIRAQHNWSDEEPKFRVLPDDRRSALEVLLDACRTAGLAYINNIDQTLGLSRQQVRASHDAFRARLRTHYEKLLSRLAPPPFADVAYDLINEPFDHRRDRYNATVAELTRLIRRRDRKHLLYVEAPESWGGVAEMRLIEPTGDALTLYSFHDYEFRLQRASDRWPTAQLDLTSIYQRFLPALRFQIEHGVALHCGEFGNSAAESHASPYQRVLLNDLLQVFDQFGMHHHYYSGREVYLAQADGSLLPSEVVRAYRDYFRDSGFNRYYGDR